MASLICHVNPGLFKHEVYIKNEKYSNKETIESYSLTLKEIPYFIVDQKDVSHVYLTGSNKDFLKKIETETKELEQKLYSTNTKKFEYI